MSKAARELRRRLAREQRTIEHRLGDAVVPNPGGPVLGRANIGYELAERSRGVAHGVMGMIAKVVGEVGLTAEIDDAVHVLAMHRPYHESDHVLNIAYNALCGGTRLDDIEARRNDAVFLDGLGAAALPDPTTAGDFCRRFDEDSIMALQEAVNRCRLGVWARQRASHARSVSRWVPMPAPAPEPVAGPAVEGSSLRPERSLTSSATSLAPRRAVSIWPTAPSMRWRRTTPNSSAA